MQGRRLRASGRRNVGRRRPADRLAFADADERLAGLQARHHVLDRCEETVAARAAQKQPGGGRAGKVVQQLCAGLQLDQRRHRLAVAAGARQRRHRHRIDPASAAERQQRVDGAAFEGAVQAVAGLERELRTGGRGRAGRLARPALPDPDPALERHHHRHRLVDHLHFGHRFLLGLDQRAAGVGEQLGVGLDLPDHQTPQRYRAAEDFVELLALFAQFLELLLDPDRLQPRQLPQPDVQDVFGLPLAQLEARDQRQLGLVALADDRDHCVDVQQHQLSAFEDVHAVQHLGQPVLRAALDRDLAKLDPLAQHQAQGLLHRPAVQADHRHVDRRRRLQAGMRQQAGDQLRLLDAAGLGLEHQPHGGILARFVAHHIQHRQQRLLELRLVG